MSLKNPVTPPEIDPGTVRLVAQRLDNYATPGPIFVISCLKCTQPISEPEGCYLLGNNAMPFVEVSAVWINMLPQSSG